MKLAACFLTLLPGFAVAASWTSPGFPAFSEQGTGTFVSHAQLPKGTRPLTLNFDQQCWQPADAIKLNQMLSLQPCSNTPPQWRLFRDGEYTLQIDTRSGTPTLMISIQNAAEPVASLVRECPKWDGLPLTVDVSATFPEGAAVRDYYSQQIAIVKNGQIMLQPAATSNGLLLLERAETDTSAPFDWHNATVYFVLTDRFENGDPSNDQSYGRHKDGMAEIGTFHGGDLRGLTNKLDYLQQLGVNALWISAPFEQIHGWVGGGTKGDFPHYAYHGYYTQDWTNLDANMGNEADLRTLVDSAHQRGIRILFDVVMNHTGYATLADMQEYQFIPSVGMEASDFWGLANSYAEEEHMDKILSYMYIMIKKSQECGIPLTRKSVMECGRTIELYNGLPEWFDRLNRFGRENGVTVEHYVLSSGLKEIIEGSEIGKCFKEIFACEFLYGENGEAVWPKTAVNYTAKTQFVYRINKGVLDVSNDRDLNRSTPDSKRRVPFSNMLYIGDGLSDVPCMKMVKAYGGCSIAVHNNNPRQLEGVSDLLYHNRVDFAFEADYSEGSGLDITVKDIIRRIAIDSTLKDEHSRQKRRSKCCCADI